MALIANNVLLYFLHYFIMNIFSSHRHMMSSSKESDTISLQLPIELKEVRLVLFQAGMPKINAQEQGKFLYSHYNPPTPSPIALFLSILIAVTNSIPLRCMYEICRSTSTSQSKRFRSKRLSQQLAARIIIG